MDFSELNEVTSVNSKKDTVGADLIYRASREKFELSELAFNILDANNNGLKMFVDNEDREVYLTVQGREDSEFYKGREDTEQKSQWFTARKLWRYLGNLFTDEDGFAITEFDLEPIEQTEDRLVLRIVEHDANTESPLLDLVDEDTEDEAPGLPVNKEPKLPDEDSSDEEEAPAPQPADEAQGETTSEDAGEPQPAGAAEEEQGEDPFDL